MLGEILVWENLSRDKQSESEILEDAHAQYFHQTDKVFYSQQNDLTLPRADQTYFVINLRSDMVS